MSKDRNTPTRVEGSQVGVVGDGARIEGGVHYGNNIHKNVITIQHVTVYRSQGPQPDETPETVETDIAPNPYLGLGAFQEQDSDRFFGREKLTQTLWEKFRDLSERGGVEKKIRLLPILGPSGSGKSSVARAGLIPELARNPLPGYARAKVGIFTPGTDPVWALAGILARMLTGDTVPAGKAEEFESILKSRYDKGEFDGLTRIAGLFPDIQDSPLVILVDQFEEVYSYYDNKGSRRNSNDKRDCFIGNLLHAASDTAGYVSVVLTLRSDFLGETQSNEALNRTIAENGEIIPAMSREELRVAVAMPAENAGHPFTEALVNNLVEQTRDHDGALPLLQFALTRLWDGMAVGKQPADTLEEIGGVGGALAGEASRLYNKLPDEEKKIVRRAFLGMVNLGEGIKDTRRRVSLDKMVAGDEEKARVKKVLEIFSARNARLITLSGEEVGGGSQAVEMTHEALLEHWTDLKTWLDEDRDALRLQRRLESAAAHWKEQKRPAGLLWRSPDLDLLRKLFRDPKSDFSELDKKFYRASERALKMKWFLFASLAILIVVGSAVAVIFVKRQEIIAKVNEKKANYNIAKLYEREAGLSLNAALKGDNPDENFQKVWLYTLEALNKDIPSERELPDSVERLGRRIIQLGLLRGAGVREDNRYRAFNPTDKTVRHWESDLAGAFKKAGKDAPEFKAVYRCSFALFPYKMEEISLVPVRDGPPGGTAPWYAEYPRPAGKDPVQWMIESAAKAVSENKLTLDGVSPAWIDKITVSDSSSAEFVKQPETVTLAPDVQMTFVFIPPGSFFMGSPLGEPERNPDEKLHMVTLTKGFYLQTTEVTQGQWKAVMGENPSFFQKCGDDCPVEQISWEDAKEFIKKLEQKRLGKYRLPTEAEWEYACRAGTTTPFYFGRCLGTKEANYNRKFPLSGCPEGEYSEGTTTPVKNFPPNSWGLYGMHGNVREWCEDVYYGYSLGEVIDPHGPSGGSYRVFRGGGWDGSARLVRSANRDCILPDYRVKNNLGFRLVLPPGQ